MLAKTWRALHAVIAVALTLVLLGLPARAVWVNRDSDGDGLSDCRERAGLRFEGGAASYATDPDRTDTDGDLVPDAVEIGPRTDTQNLADSLDLLWDCRSQTYSAVSDPSRPDSDFDGLSDAIELSDGSDVFAQDSDGDGLHDVAERRWGSDPNGEDTDGDGYRDVEDVSAGRAPVSFDRQASDEPEWAVEFAEGLLLGEFEDVDSLAQLVGTATANSGVYVPVAGRYIRLGVGARDTAASLIKLDPTAAMTSATAAFSSKKTRSKIARIVGDFVDENPDEVRDGLEQLGAWDRIPVPARAELIKRIERLDDADIGRLDLTDDRIVKLAESGVRVADLVSHTARGAQFESQEGEDLLMPHHAQAALRDHVTGDTGSSATGVYLAVAGHPAGRLFDVCTDCQPHPSPGSSELYVAKLGSQVWSDTIRSQVDRDAALVDSGYAVEWHFFAGPTGLDVDEAIADALVDADISYVVHLPA